MKAPFLRASLVSLLAAGGILLFAVPSLAQDERPRVLAVELENDINPVTQDYLNDAIERANDGDYGAVVVVLDTPGGLGSAMENIVKKILESKIPVVVYVSPSGGGAASAGVFIAQAADVLAMAPNTAIGASTPISGTSGDNLPSDARRKAINFYAAKLRNLAASHGRNGNWADAAVRKGSSRSAVEALRENIIDAVAPNLTALLEQIDGAKTVPKKFVLDTAGAEVETVEMGLWKRILDTLIDPNIIALLLSLGVLGLVVELWNPGLIFPATFGVVSLIVGFWGLQVLPISWAGLLLMLFAFAFWIAELFVGFSHGALSLAGAVCFVFGALLLFEPAGDAYQVSLPVALSVAGAVTLFFVFALAKVIAIGRRPVEVGVHSLVGTHGVARGDQHVAVKGELWRAARVDGEPLRSGDQVEIVDVEGLSVVVKPAEEHEPVGSPS